VCVATQHVAVTKNPRRVDDVRPYLIRFSTLTTPVHVEPATSTMDGAVNITRGLMSNSTLTKSGSALFCNDCKRHHHSKVCNHCCVHKIRHQYTGILRYLSGEVIVRSRLRRHDIEHWLNNEARTGSVSLAVVQRTRPYCTVCGTGRISEDD